MKRRKFSWGALWDMLRKIAKTRWVKIPAAILLILILFYMVFLNYNEPTEIGVARNLISGEMWLQEGGGYFVTPPWVWVARIDARPVRVSVTSAGRGYSAKLVQFDKRGWREFVEIEGWRYWWWANRISFNWGYDEEHRGMKDILRGYAYGPKKYSFLVVLEEYQSK